VADPAPAAPAPPPDDKIYKFEVKLDVKVEGVAQPTVAATFSTNEIVKANCLVNPPKAALQIPKFTAAPAFVLLTPLPGAKDAPAPNLTYSFGTDKAKATPLNGPQVFFNGAEQWLGATGPDGKGVDAINFWADNPVTVQVIIGFNAPPPAKGG
jgi:hypothetical protein